MIFLKDLLVMITFDNLGFRISGRVQRFVVDGGDGGSGAGIKGGDKEYEVGKFLFHGGSDDELLCRRLHRSYSESRWLREGGKKKRGLDMVFWNFASEKQLSLGRESRFLNLVSQYVSTLKSCW